MNEILDYITTIVILLSSILLILCYGELTIHTYSLRKMAEKEGVNGQTAAELINQGLLAAGIAGGGAWLLLATTAGNAGGIVQLVTVVLLLAGAIGAAWLYVRIRFK